MTRQLLPRALSFFKDDAPLTWDETSNDRDIKRPLSETCKEPLRRVEANDADTVAGSQSKMDESLPHCSHLLQVLDKRNVTNYVADKRLAYRTYLLLDKQVRDDKTRHTMAYYVKTYYMNVTVTTIIVTMTPHSFVFELLCLCKSWDMKYKLLSWKGLHLFISPSFPSAISFDHQGWVVWSILWRKCFLHLHPNIIWLVFKIILLICTLSVYITCNDSFGE